MSKLNFNVDNANYATLNHPLDGQHIGTVVNDDKCEERIRKCISDEYALPENDITIEIFDMQPSDTWINISIHTPEEVIQIQALATWIY